MLLPLGTTVEGSVTEVRKVGIGVVHETARIELHFDRVVRSSGQYSLRPCASSASVVAPHLPFERLSASN